MAPVVTAVPCGDLPDADIEHCTNAHARVSTAEFRGPGVHHNFDDNDSGNDYDNESSNKGKSFGIGGYRGRIIFLGDGTEVLTDSDDTEMFDNSEEDKDLASQVSKKSTSADGNGHEVIGSPVTPEKLDPKFDLNQKASGSGSATEGSSSSEAAKEGEKDSQTAAKKET